MGYKKTGNPPGRPRKPVAEAAPEYGVAPIIASGELAAIQEENAEKAKTLSRAREGFRRAHADPTEGLYRLPRYGIRRRHVGKRPMLHPNVIAKA